MGETFDLIEFLATLPEADKSALGYRPDDAEWWFGFSVALYRDQQEFELPTLLDTRDEPIYEMALRGLEFTVSEGALSPQEAADLIRGAEAEERFADVLLALDAAGDPALLLEASPERRTFAEEFLERVEHRRPS